MLAESWSIKPGVIGIDFVFFRWFYLGTAAAAAATVSRIDAHVFFVEVTEIGIVSVAVKCLRHCPREITCKLGGSIKWSQVDDDIHKLWPLPMQTWWLGRLRFSVDGIDTVSTSSRFPAAAFVVVSLRQSIHTDRGIGALSGGGGPSSGSRQYTDWGIMMAKPLAKVPLGHAKNSPLGSKKQN